MTKKVQCPECKGVGFHRAIQNVDPNAPGGPSSIFAPAYEACKVCAGDGKVEAGTVE